MELLERLNRSRRFMPQIYHWKTAQVRYKPPYENLTSNPKIAPSNYY
jgi:hypothetical protein